MGCGHRPRRAGASALPQWVSACWNPVDFNSAPRGTWYTHQAGSGYICLGDILKYAVLCNAAE